MKSVPRLPRPKGVLFGRSRQTCRRRTKRLCVLPRTHASPSKTVLDESTENASAWKKSKAQRMLPKSWKGLMLSGVKRVSRSGPFWSVISTLEGCRRRRVLSLRPSLGQVKQSTSLLRWSFLTVWHVSSPVSCGLYLSKWELEVDKRERERERERERAAECYDWWGNKRSLLNWNCRQIKAKCASCNVACLYTKLDIDNSVSMFMLHAFIFLRFLIMCVVVIWLQLSGSFSV